MIHGVIHDWGHVLMIPHRQITDKSVKFMEQNIIYTPDLSIS